MQCCLDDGLDVKLEKCDLHKETVKYLRLLIPTIGISMDQDKVEIDLN